MTRFRFIFEFEHEGVVFSDGHVVIWGRVVGREKEIHEYEDLDYMLMELCLQPEAITWLDPLNSIRSAKPQLQQGGPP